MMRLSHVARAVPKASASAVVAFWACAHPPFYAFAAEEGAFGEMTASSTRVVSRCIVCTCVTCRRLPKFVGRPMGPGHTKKEFHLITLEALNGSEDGATVSFETLFETGAWIAVQYKN